MSSQENQSRYPFNRETAEAVLAFFPQSEATDFQFLPQDKGQATEVARLIINNQAYALKKLLPSTQFKCQQQAMALQQYLFQNSFPCPEFLSTEEGSIFVTFQGSHFTLQTWLQGEHIAPELRSDIPLPLAEKLGAMVGQLHGHLSKLPAENYPDLPSVSFVQQQNNLNAWTQIVFKGRPLRPSTYLKLKIRPGKNDFDRFVLSVLSQWRPVVSYLNTWLSEQNQNFSELSLVHGDLNWENILLNNDQLALIDFDNLQRQPLACEIASALAIFCPFSSEAQRHFLDEYQKQDLPVPSFSILHHLMLLKYVRSFSWQISQWYLNKNQKPILIPWITFLGEGLLRTWKKLN
ncbi:MAG: phosphotransferase [bacterium]|nr:phosphotransferase [bacterium]